MGRADGQCSTVPLNRGVTHFRLDQPSAVHRRQATFVDDPFSRSLKRDSQYSFVGQVDLEVSKGWVPGL